MPERYVPGSPEWRIGGHQHLQRYMFAGDRVAGQRVLDLACGVGYGSYVLSQAADREVLGLDISPEAIAYGQQHYQRPGLRFVAADVIDWHSTESPFHTVVSFETIEHLADPPAFVSRLASMLVPGGRLIISAPNTLLHKKAPRPIENPHHLNEPDYATLADWLERHFVIEAEWEQSTITHPVTDGLDDMRTLLDTLSRRWWVRAANRIEAGCRRMFGHTDRKISEQRREPFFASTDIFPLLPERRAHCEVFVFVCRRRGADGA